MYTQLVHKHSSRYFMMKCSHCHIWRYSTIHQTCTLRSKTWWLDILTTLKKALQAGLFSVTFFSSTRRKMERTGFGVLEMRRRPFFIVGSLLSKKGISELYSRVSYLGVGGKYLSKDRKQHYHDLSKLWNNAKPLDRKLANIYSQSDYNLSQTFK